MKSFTGRVVAFSLSLVLMLSLVVMPGLAASSPQTGAGVGIQTPAVHNVNVIYWSGFPTDRGTQLGNAETLEAGQVFTVRNAHTHPAPTRPGFIFDGWRYEAVGLPTTHENGSVINHLATVMGGSRIVAPAGDFHFVARWRQPVIMFNWNFVGAPSNPIVTVPVGQSLTAAQLPPNAVHAIPSRPGYTFIGWGMTPNVGVNQNAQILAMVIDDSRTFYAQWRADDPPPPPPPSPPPPSPPSPPPPPPPPPLSPPPPPPLQPPVEELIFEPTPAPPPEPPPEPLSEPPPDITPFEEVDILEPGDEHMFGDGDGPLAPFEGDGFLIFAPIDVASWALVNLILTIAGVLLAIMIIVRAIKNKKREKESDASDIDSGDYGTNKKRLSVIWLTAALVMGILGVILFIFTQDMTRTMALLDWWTIAHILITAVQIIATTLVFKRRKETFEQRLNRENFVKA